MPEIPEMETYRRLLQTKLAGRVITGVVIDRPKSLNVEPSRFRQEVVRRELLAVDRRAKQLIFRLNSGQSLLLHLMLDGWLFVGTEAEKPDRTAQIVLRFGEENLYFIGLRLGYLHLLSADGLKKTLDKYGPEPLDASFTPEVLASLLKRRRGTVKTALMDQKVLAGIGNCYADEICFEAGMLPVKKCGELTEQDIRRLHASMRFVLTEAIRCGGYMEHPLYVGDELTGGFDERCRVYDRGGEPCRRCGGYIVETVISARKCFYCPNCQR